MNEAERRESAQAREQTARKHGALKVFVSYDEAALIHASLTWLRADLAEANDALESMPPQLKENIPPNTFTMMDEVIEATQKGLLIHATSDIAEENVEVVPKNWTGS